jgi:hypothetical protein
MGHRLFNGSIVWSKSYSFKAPPYPGQDSLQRVVILGDLGKVSSLFTNLIFNEKFKPVVFCMGCQKDLDFADFSKPID